MTILVACWVLVPARAFETPKPGHRFVFPRDDGAHPAFRIEWWYITGHLFEPAPTAAKSPPAGRRFGFEATFFRFAAPHRVPEPNPDFSVNEIELTHMAVTDVAAGRFYHEARLNRAGWDAHAATGTLDVVNGEWSLRLVPSPSAGNDGSAGNPADSAFPHRPGSPRFVLHGGIQARAAFNLVWTPAKPLVVFGKNGVSRKGADPSEASYYLSYSRLVGGGRLTLGTRSYEVRGEAWMDHEISSSQLGKGQVGWDWTCVQFGDGAQRVPGIQGESAAAPWELMLYRIRRADGSADPYSRLQWVDPAGKPIDEPFDWKVLSWWKSPHTGARYPSRVRLTTRDPRTGRQIVLEIDPLLQDQELPNEVGGGAYWEGDCRVRDASGHDVGNAYLELTGYAKPLRF
ncbi:MAG: lipocalin-like domain-containing protein [Opitutaceae bacterium]